MNSIENVWGILQYVVDIIDKDDHWQSALIKGLVFRKNIGTNSKIIAEYARKN